MAITEFETRTKAPAEKNRRSWTPYRFKADQAADGFDLLARLAKAVFGIAAAVAGLSLWIVPGSDFSVDIVAVKVTITAGLWVLAALLWRSSRDGEPREIHIDFERQEVRVVAVCGGKETPRKVYSFSELGSMEIEDNALHLYTEAGQRLAVMPLDAPGGHQYSL
ncbi:MAG: hypothetical protein AAGA47_10695 [Pseudomonadota bacterium]